MTTRPSDGPRNLDDGHIGDPYKGHPLHPSALAELPEPDPETTPDEAEDTQGDSP